MSHILSLNIESSIKSGFSIAGGVSLCYLYIFGFWFLGFFFVLAYQEDINLCNISVHTRDTNSLDF